MVLCPYVFLLTRHDVPPLRLQPTEVASTHWVPLTELLSAEQRTEVHEDVSNRLANQETGVKRWMLRAMVGKMIFSAIRLVPSESVQCRSSPAEDSTGGNMLPLAGLWNFGPRKLAPARHEQPLLLWGLTLGVLADFLDLLPPHTALKLWSYPTFTPWDVRLVIWTMSYTFKQRKMREIQQIQTRPSITAVEEGLDAVPMPEQQRLNEGGIHGLNTGLDHAHSRTELKASAVGTMLEGYYDIVRRAVALALVGRVSVAVAVCAWLLARRRRHLHVK